MNEIIIRKQDFSHIIKKSDVWLVYTTNKRCWVCCIGGYEEDGDLITLTLATKGKCEVK